ncbi:MAG: prepilin-type N-terminal cleavage/methylation domain-containing protein [Rickettsiales bacterium]|nr:prepilin-type N-terminal cleavage/methylation domain-containing protein [Rickettsiales bacterium]
MSIEFFGIYMSNFCNNNGFSNMELSVVLVIAGLLLAAITYVAAMIKDSVPRQRRLDIETLDIASVL